MLANLAERREAMLGQLHEMQSRLLSVADDLEVAIQPSVSPPAPPAESVEPTGSGDPSPRSAAPPQATASPTEVASLPIEELWVASEAGPTHADGGLSGLFDEPATEDDLPDLPDLSDLDLDLDLDDEPGGGR